MPRLNRKYYISSFLHVMVQGINKEDIFKTDFYKNFYIKLIKSYQQNFDIQVLAYVVMNNHVHILLYYKEIEEVSKYIGSINQKFAQFYNKNENRVGYVFRGRYRCEQIKDKEHLYNVLPYIHFNPYKSGNTSKLIDYAFSSYPSYINNNIDYKNVLLLFDTYNYKELFIDLHQQYFEKFLNKKLTCEDIIREYKSKNKIVTTEIILKDNNMLIELISEIQNRIPLTNKEISEILGIGKNRITNLKKKLQGK